MKPAWPRTAEWLEDDYAQDEKESLRERRLRSLEGAHWTSTWRSPRTSYGHNPLKAGRKWWRSTVVSIEKLPSETLWTQDALYISR